MNEKRMEEIKCKHEMELLDQHFPGKSCGNSRCENLCRNVCAAAIRLRMSPEELVDHAIQTEIIPHYSCEKSLALSDKKIDSDHYLNKGKPIPGCRFGYAYGSHPPKTDDQLAAQKKSSKTSTSKSRWEKIKGHVSNAIQALQVGTGTAGAPAGTGEMVGGVKAATNILLELPIQAKYTKRLVAKLEEKTGETRLDLYFQIQDCISKQDFKRLLIIQGKVRRRLEELEKQGK